MNTHKDKKSFLATLKMQIEHREELRKFYENQWGELLKKWDGKVYNKRFRDDVDEELKKVSPRMSAEFKEPNCRDSYSNMNGKPMIEVKLRYQNEQYNYTDHEQLWTRVVCHYDDNWNIRISAEDTPKETYVKNWFENFAKDTEEHKSVLDNYDKYMKVAEKMEQAVKMYNELPYRFRLNIDTRWIHI